MSAEANHGGGHRLPPVGQMNAKIALDLVGVAETCLEMFRDVHARRWVRAERRGGVRLLWMPAQGWTITPLEVSDATEARGINTPADLAFFRSLYKDAP